MSNTVFTVRLSDETKDQVEALAKATNRSKSYIVIQAIEDYIRRNAWRAKELQEAVAEADRGVFVSGDAVEEWLDSWGAETELPAPAPDIKPVRKPRAS